jgi:uncharacterized caspase-like protein
MRPAARLSILSICLLAMSGFSALVSSAAAQQQEKRIALVVGNGAYAKTPLATAANDAGLIAQTLQAAGFDVIGARDLDGDTLRKSFRDFIQKAEASGPGTVAMVYLSGYGMQLGGENYFVPVDSTISRDTDVPIEALRVGDYLRQLASLPIKASIVVLDAARQQPFVEGQIASGLALVEPDPHMLIAFNAAPGTIAPQEQGPYGAYAQSLAEMIRTGGLPLPEVFNRVRLRVNEASKGAQVPWDTQKIDAPFMFFERAPDAPAQPPSDQNAAIRDKPIRDLGVQDAYIAALNRDTLQGYEDFLAAYASDPLARRVKAIVAARREAITWRRSYRADTPNAYWSYLRRYPGGPHAADARRRLAILTAPLEPPPTFAVFDYDVPPPPPDEIIYVDRPVLMFSDPEFDFAPPPPPPFFFLPPPPPDFVILLPPPAPIGLFILPQPFFVPIPVYVRAPVYVAPPRNNIIFANSHNTTVINNVINKPPASPPPGNPAAAAAAGGSGGAGPQVPQSVKQQATLIQQGKKPMPASASINPTDKSAAPAISGDRKAAPTTVSPPNASPNALSKGGEALPKDKLLPVPGTKGAPPAPLGGAGPGPGTAHPDAKLAPGGQQGTNLPVPQVGQPKASGSTQVPETKRLVPEARPGASKPNGAPVLPAKPATVAPPKSTPSVAPKPEMRRVEPPHRAAPPPPPPRPAPQMARPAAPPPRAAPPPPRPAPAPPPRPAPQVARPAPPPPPRPAPPPARPAPAAKKCPPNVAKC